MTHQSFNAQNSISDKHFKGMIESTPGIPWSVDLATFQFTYVGPQAETVLGYPVDDWYKNDFWGNHIHPDDRETALTYCAEAAQKDENYNFEYRMIHKDGHSVHILDYVNIVKENGKPIYLQGFMFDITNQKNIEDAITNIAIGVSKKNGNALYDQLVQSLATVFNANFVFIGLLENSTPPMSVTSISTWANGDFIDHFTYSLKNTPCEESIEKNTYIHLNEVKNKSPLDQLLIGMSVHNYITTPLFNLDDIPIGLIVIGDNKEIKNTSKAFDILEIFSARASSEIERKKAEDKLKQHQNDLEKIIALRTSELIEINKELESFSYSVSHDLRAPLRSIAGFSQILTEDYADILDKDALNYLDRIRVSTQDMGNLIDALLKLSRINKKPICRERISITDMSTKIINNIKIQNPERTTNLVIQQNMNAEADKQLMTSVLENLINNAWKYSSKKPETYIEIGSYLQKTCTPELENAKERVFFIKDHGAGFNMDYKNKLFSAFQRLHSKNDFDGTGIGLTTVQRIIHRHGGKVWAESELSTSATFYFTLNNQDIS